MQIKLNERQPHQPYFFFQIQSNFLIKYACLVRSICCCCNEIFGNTTIWLRTSHLVNDIQTEYSDMKDVHTRILPTSVLFCQFKKTKKKKPEQSRAVMLKSHTCPFLKLFYFFIYLYFLPTHDIFEWTRFDQKPTRNRPLLSWFPTLCCSSNVPNILYYHWLVAHLCAPV